MIINSQADLISVLVSFVLGFLLSVIYDIFKAFRIAFNSSKISIIIQDIIFFVLAALLTFLVMFIYESGKIRWFVLFSELVGFLITKIYISHYLYKILLKLFRFFKKHLFIPLFNVFVALGEKINIIIDKFISIFLKKLLKH